MKALSDFSTAKGKQLSDLQIRELQEHLKYLNNLADEIKYRVEQVSEILREIFENSTVEPNTETGPEPKQKPVKKTIIEFRESELAGLPWRDFQNKSGSWVFSNQAPKLADELQKEPKKTLKLGEYTYRLSGDDDKFINRYKKSRKSRKR